MKIELKNVTKELKHTRVLDNVSVTFKSSRVYGLRGINGSGKTMLMRAIAGFIHPTSGQIIVDAKILGKDIDFPPSMGLMLEYPAMLDELSAFENLRLISKIKKKVTRQDIVNSIQSVGLSAEERKPFCEFSLGMKQRLGIAGALFENPELILLDEPTNSLDVDGIMMVKELISVHKKRGALIIVSSHDQSVLDELCDTVYQMQAGKLLGAGNE